MNLHDDDLWVCTDCALFIANGDLTGLDYHYSEDEAREREAAIFNGVEYWATAGCHLHVSDGEDEFSRTVCACCNAWLAGRRMQVVALCTHENCA